MRFGFSEGSRAILTCALAWHLSGGKAYAHMPEGSLALLFWMYAAASSLLPLLATLALNRRLRAQRRAATASQRMWAMAIIMAVVNVCIGAVLLRYFLGELDRPRLGPEPRVAWEVTATPMAIAIAALQLAVGVVAAVRVLWPARADHASSKGA